MAAPSSMASQHLHPPAPTPILRPTEVKRQFCEHADFATYTKSIKKFLNGSITKTEFHAELSKVLPTKEKRTPSLRISPSCVVLPFHIMVHCLYV